MRRACIIGLALAGLLLVSGARGAGQAQQRWIVHLQGPPQQAQAAVAVAVERSGGRVLHAFSLIPAVAVELPLPALQGILNNPNLQESVSGVEPDAIVTATKKPDKPGGGRGKKPKEEPPQTLEWGVDRIDAELAWAISRGAAIKVCVIDTGIDKDHPDLEANVKGGENFTVKGRKINPDAWDDDNGHGTHVAGIIAAVDNDTGVIGVAPGASLYAAKALDRAGVGYVSTLVAALEWAVDNEMDVVNMSLGTSADIDALHDACEEARAAGLVLVASAGNEGDGNAETDDVSYPAAYDSVIAVAATDSLDDVPWWSSSGPEVELAAPGVDVRSTWKGGSYKTESGTSMAAPHVSGTAALVLAAVGEISPNELRAWLATTAEDIGALDNVSGNGLVDAEESTTGN